MGLKNHQALGKYFFLNIVSLKYSNELDYKVFRI